MKCKVEFLQIHEVCWHKKGSNETKKTIEDPCNNNKKFGVARLDESWALVDGEWYAKVPLKVLKPITPLKLTIKFKSAYSRGGVNASMICESEIDPKDLKRLSRNLAEIAKKRLGVKKISFGREWGTDADDFIF